ncbi:hypothetical protein [Polaribacter sp. HL-MS24]|uniref:hypothetical protein n=1 Tax=Polaribacter sp. HL-MS24 TaxID=3077735 RepID=UPI00293438E5|nr:hypothetical protein [Polaribacter sp. HL-MS24]WOC39348.1 hypothetical protein RRF69_06535 [Polaribacter sp. HL-MS24]
MKNKFLKGGLLVLTMIAGTALQAQTTSATDASLVKDAGDGVSVKLIDNKGTIKYLQTNNGITSITSTTAGSATTTTWQLGGTLTDDTYIDVNANVFALDGLQLETGSAATSAPDGSDAATSTDTGWALIVRDEDTGELKKLLATDLISGIYKAYPQVADAVADVAITVTGLPVLTATTTLAKLFVYRNGAKLRSGTDFVATADTVTITYSAADLPMYAGDVVEIQYIK